MATVGYITRTVQKLISKYQTRNPYEICDGLGIRIIQKDLCEELQAYYYYTSRIRNIVLNNRVSEMMQRILVAHELGHDRLHRQIALLKGFQETEVFIQNIPTEYEANLFAAELLIDDEEVLGFLSDDDKDFFGVASELCVPADFLDFKFRLLLHKGYCVEPQYIASGDMLKGKIARRFDSGGNET
jgi:Zn-dependent peptidase ImmA (M78 family)